MLPGARGIAARGQHRRKGRTQRHRSCRDRHGRSPGSERPCPHALHPFPLPDRLSAIRFFCTFEDRNTTNPACRYRRRLQRAQIAALPLRLAAQPETAEAGDLDLFSGHQTAAISSNREPTRVRAARRVNPASSRTANAR